MTELTAERARELFDYDPLTGVLTWKRSGTGRRANLVAGCVNSLGYLVTRADGELHYNHRLVWLFVHGAWPSQQVDHINGVKYDNRLCNLRSASPKTNSENKSRARRGSVSGILGATWNARRRCYTAQITSGGVNFNLGGFSTPEEANAAYVAAKRLLHAGCTI
jgi:HNH endonuclease